MQSKLWENDDMTEEDAEEVERQAQLLKIKMVRASERVKEWGMQTGLNRSAQRGAALPRLARMQITLRGAGASRPSAPLVAVGRSRTQTRPPSTHAHGRKGGTMPRRTHARTHTVRDARALGSSPELIRGCAQRTLHRYHDSKCRCSL
jgi:hypothetical protein